MSLLLDYAGVEMNAPGRIRADTERGLSPLPLRWATGAKWSRRQDLHPHWTRSELVASALGYAGKNEWCSRQEFRLQPPRSKRGALYIELRERCGNGAPGRFCPACLRNVGAAIC